MRHLFIAINDYIINAISVYMHNDSMIIILSPKVGSFGVKKSHLVLQNLLYKVIKLENESLKVLTLIQEGHTAIKETLPGVLEGFQSLAQSIINQELISPKVKELMAVAVAVGIKCQPCIVHHVKRALDQGATAAEILEACSVAIMMGGGPSIAYTSYVVQALKDFKALEQKD